MGGFMNEEEMAEELEAESPDWLELARWKMAVAHELSANYRADGTAAITAGLASVACALLALAEKGSEPIPLIALKSPYQEMLSGEIAGLFKSGEVGGLTEPQQELLRDIVAAPDGLPLRDRSRARADVASSLKGLGLIEGWYAARPGWMTWRATEAGRARPGPDDTQAGEPND